MGNNGQIISIKQAAGLLEISEATVRNWVRHGYLSSVVNTKSRFQLSDVIGLKNKIENGEIDRLRKRANKKKAGITFIPDEYLHDNSFVDEVEKIRDHFLSRELDLESSILVLGLKQLVLREEVTCNNPANLFDLNSFSSWRRDCVKNEIASWMTEIDIPDEKYSDEYSGLFNLLRDVSHNDTVGIIYQSLMVEGNKSKKGSYYTPRELIEGIFNTRKEEGKFLDPCCGTGQFLICAARSGYEDSCALYGFDIDNIAVRIARLNILLVFCDEEFTPNIYKADTLRDVANGLLLCETNNLRHSFQLVATNPPWGASYEKDEIKELNSVYPAINSGESFSYFLAKSMELVSEGGSISFILPEAILNIRTHLDIRSHILAVSTIEKITCFGRKFKGVFSPVIRVDLLNSIADDDGEVQIITDDGKVYKVPQTRFLKNEYNIFDVYLTEEESQIIEYLYSLPHVTLKGMSEWALGIVTGNNKKYLSDEYHDGMEPIYRGSDVDKYSLKNPSRFIKFTPELFQQVAPENKYRAKEKLIYKFISNRLVFAYDDKQSLTLNSANILIPQIENYPIKAILGLLNSKLYQFIFLKKFNTHKILRGDLEKLPLPLMSDVAQHSIIQLVDQALDGQSVETELDNLIMQICGLSGEQAEIVMKTE